MLPQLPQAGAIAMLKEQRHDGGVPTAHSVNPALPTQALTCVNEESWSS